LMIGDANLDWKRLHDMVCLLMIGDAKFIC